MMDDHEQPVSPPDPREEPPRRLDYVRPTTNSADRRPFPVVAGMGVGLCVFLGAVAIWWSAARGSGSAMLLGLAVVPMFALVVAGILQMTFGWRGVIAGVLLGVGLAVLIPGVAILVICGGMRLK